MVLMGTYAQHSLTVLYNHGNGHFNQMKLTIFFPIQVENRKELSERGKTHLDSYVGESESFTGWLKGTEMKLQALGPLPRNKELLTDNSEELQVGACISVV